MPEVDDLALLIDTAQAAGALAVGLQEDGVRHWKKDDRSPVSEADLAVDRLIRERLTAARPGYSWLSEESDPNHTTHERTFVVDPIDGTRAYLAGRDTWTVSLAVMADGAPLAGVVFNPRRNELYAATGDTTTTLNGDPITAAPTLSLAGATLAGGAGVYAQAELFSSLRPEPVFMGATSMAYRLCLVASGRCDATVSLSNKSDWDLAAGVLLVHQAGGRVSDGAGNPIILGRHQRHPSLVAANPHLHDEIVHRLTQERADP